MKKIKLRLQQGQSVVLKNAAQSVNLQVEDFSIDLCRASWAVRMSSDRVAHGTYGVQVPLSPLWPDSWLALSGPITVHVGGGRYRPEFIAFVPDDVTWEVLHD